jgi:hypothetical protein
MGHASCHNDARYMCELQRGAARGRKRESKATAHIGSSSCFSSNLATLRAHIGSSPCAKNATNIGGYTESWHPAAEGTLPCMHGAHLHGAHPQKQKLDSHKGFLEWSKGFVMLAPPSVTTNEAETLSNAEQCWQREAALTGAPSAPGAN